MPGGVRHRDVEDTAEADWDQESNTRLLTPWPPFLTTVRSLPLLTVIYVILVRPTAALLSGPIKTLEEKQFQKKKKI